MKKHFLTLLMVLSLFQFGYAQVPSAIPYQAVVRNGTGSILTNYPVQLRFTIHDSITNGNAVYQETHSISTNGQGLVITNIGQGTSTTGSFSGIIWGKNNKFVQTELSINNDNTFTDLGTTQFLSVPYALHSKTAENGMPSGSSPGEMLFWDGTSWVKVAPGSEGQTLTFCDGKPHWGACPVGLQINRDIDGNVYDTSSVCNQLWMTQNLNVSRYRNGDIIPQVTDPTQWANLTTGAWCYYNNDSANGAVYGKLYNWYAVNDPRGLAPEGWHIPCNEEWNSVNDCRYYINSNDTNRLNLMLSGIRDESGNFGQIGQFSSYWSSNLYGFYTDYYGYFDCFFNPIISCNPYGTNGRYYINANSSGPLNNGKSVRCAKDNSNTPPPPPISTYNILNISSNSAYCGGFISYINGITSRGVCWSTSNNPTIDLTTKTTDGTGIGSFTSSMTGLSPNTTYYVRSYATNGEGTSYGSEMSFTTQSVNNNTGIGITDIDGNTYDTLRICNQTWTKKNLNVSRYRNGDIIPQVTDQTQWVNLTTGAWCYYNNDSANGAIYGKLYNWYAVNDARGLAPEGWHVPNNGEWNKLVKCLDVNADTTIIDWRSTIAGNYLKSTNGWLDNGNGNNISGFTGLPSGYRTPDATFISEGIEGDYWSSTTYDDLSAGFSSLHYYYSGLFRTNITKSFGISIRLVKDEPLPTINDGISDIDGNTYDTVRICNQTWTKKNLNVSRYRNGDIIPQVTDPTQWSNLTTGAWCWYNNDSANGAVYGKLYNWYAVNDPRGLAPEGWHVSTDGEWNKLVKYIETGADTVCLNCSQSATAGGAIKSTTGWDNPNVCANNSSGFSSFPSGYRYTNGLFFGKGGSCYMWSANNYNPSNALFRDVTFDYCGVDRGYYFMTMGLSVRLVKDEPPSTLNDGLVAYYPFNGNANDESGNGNNGVVNGATLTTDRFGNSGKAYSFDGINNYINIPHNSIFDFGTNINFSFSFWIKTSANQSNIGLIGKETASNPGQGCQIMILSNKPRFDFMTAGPNEIEFSGTTTINNGLWHNIVLTANRTANVINFYKDGVINSSIIDQNLSIGNVSNPSSLKIGVERVLGNFFNGSLDDIRIYNRALTQEEISYLATH